MKKELYFYFYVTEDYKDYFTNKIHFKCLEYYKDRFDTVTIGISINDTNDVDTIYEIEAIFIKIFKGKPINFIILENDPNYCESKFFYEEIVNKLESHDCVFFAHNKGLTLKHSTEEERENIYYWLVGLYYGSLHENRNFGYELCCYYGSFRTFCDKYLDQQFTKTSVFYAGTFYWLMCKRIHNYIKLESKELPPLDGRFYAENFVTYVYPDLSDSKDSIYIYFDNITHMYYYYEAKKYCEIVNYLNDDFYELYNIATKDL